MAPQPFDVASLDPHTVKPWFNGKLAGAPRVVDLARVGFPLLGGRLDVVGATAVPTLVYGHRKHLISVTAVPVAANETLAPVHSTVGGYHVTRWIERGECYWVVSDTAVADLDRFAELFRTAAVD
jgi:anti-sigma factor RsiW